MEKENKVISDRSISITQVLLAPVSLVWEMWVNPAHIANWWGPAGFTNTIHQMDVRADGQWHLTMHSADGKNYTNKSQFKEIVSHHKMVFQHFNPDYLATITFEPTTAGTLLNWTMLFETSQLFETVVKVFKADEGLQQNLEKLTRYLKQQQT